MTRTDQYMKGAICLMIATIIMLFPVFTVEIRCIFYIPFIFLGALLYILGASIIMTELGWIP